MEKLNRPMSWRNLPYKGEVAMPPHLTATALELGIRFSRGTLLLFLIMLFLIPMSIYAILFFRELSHLAAGLGGVHPRSKKRRKPQTGYSFTNRIFGTGNNGSNYGIPVRRARWR
jgi:hypothetical protein